MKINYVVNPTIKKTACVISEYSEDITKSVIKSITDSGLSNTLLCTGLSELVSEYAKNSYKTIIGVAICAKTDVFDENVGKNIAYQRAMIQYNYLKLHLLYEVLKPVIESLVDTIKQQENSCILDKNKLTKCLEDLK